MILLDSYLNIVFWGYLSDNFTIFFHHIKVSSSSTYIASLQRDILIWGEGWFFVLIFKFSLK